MLSNSQSPLLNLSPLLLRFRDLRAPPWSSESDESSLLSEGSVSSLSSEHEPGLELESDDSDDSELEGAGFFFFSLPFFLLFFFSTFLPAFLSTAFSTFFPAFSFLRSSSTCFLSFLLFLLRLHVRNTVVVHSRDINYPPTHKKQKKPTEKTVIDERKNLRKKFKSVALERPTLFFL
jgi:hypothetical protein